MKKFLTILLLPVFVLIFASQTNPPTPQHQQGGGTTVNQDSLIAEREKYVKMVKEAIKGKEQVRADSVFKNLKILKEVPAERLLSIMSNGAPFFRNYFKTSYEVTDVTQQGR